MRWDPTDVYQRRARYALLAGMWGFFFALFSLPEVALLLGALALYWAISSLRGSSKNGSGSGEEPGTSKATRSDPFATPNNPPHSAAYPSTSDRPYATSGQHHTDPEVPSAKPGTSAAISGLVAAGLTLLIVIATYSVQLAYHDYYSCVHDALTHEGQMACNSELPKSLVSIFGISQ
jgi:hypothetical protein